MCAIIPHSAISDAHPFRALQSKALPCHPPHAHSQCFQVPSCREVSPQRACLLSESAGSVCGILGGHGWWGIWYWHVMGGTHKECSDSKHRLQMLALLLGGRKDKGGTLEAPLIGCCEQSMMEDQVSIQGASGL